MTSRRHVRRPLTALALAVVTALLTSLIALLPTAPAHAAAYAVTLKTSSTNVDAGSKLNLAGGVTPASAGKKVYLQTYSASGWSTIGSKTLTTKSQYLFSVTPTKPGTRSSA